jgi:hypothetical protein
MPLCPKDATFGDPLLDDFRNFLHRTLNRLKGVDPSPNQYEIGDWLWRGGVTDHLENPQNIPDKRMAEALRGVGKSTIAYIYVVWEVRRAYEHTNGAPDCHFMIVSGTKDLADAAARFMRDLISGDPFLEMMVPTDPDEKWSGTTMNVRGRKTALAPTIFARGLFGRMTGDRADCIVFDDIEIPQNAETQVQREKLRVRSQEFVDVLTPHGEMIGLGTPQVEDTVYVEIEEWGFKRRKWPARFPDPSWMAKHGDLLAPRLSNALEDNPNLEGKPTEPRFTEEVLAKREAVSRTRFALQNMLDTSLGDEDRYPLKLRDLIITDLEPESGPEQLLWTNDDRRKLELPCVGLTGDGFYGPRSDETPFQKFDFKLLAVDPSGRGKDETGYAVLGTIGGNIYVLECRGLVGGYGPHVLSQLTARAAHYRVNEIISEDNFGDGMFTALLSSAVQERVDESKANDAHPWVGASIEEVKNLINKEQRIIDTLEPVMNQHRLCLDRSVVSNDRPGVGESAETYRLFHQMTRIARVKGALAHYDRLDALAIGVARLVERMNLRSSHAMSARQKREEAEYWKGWHEHNPAAQRWVENQQHRNPITKGKRRLTTGPSQLSPLLRRH